MLRFGPLGRRVIQGVGRGPLRHPAAPQLVFVFFSNRLGCLGSLLVSLVMTVVLLLVLGVINTN
jgi:hypothetical protein